MRGCLQVVLYRLSTLEQEREFQFTSVIVLQSQSPALVSNALINTMYW